MSTRPDDRLVRLISQWLARHVSDDELRSAMAGIELDGLPPEQREAVEELAAELDSPRGRGPLERVARETLEALALG